jgi:hypothetical protein
MVEWLVEFEGQQRRLDDIWSDELAKVVGPTRDEISAVLDSAPSPEDLEGLRVIIYAEEGEWGFKLKGPPLAVNYATDLIGQSRQIGRPSN